MARKLKYKLITTYLRSRSIIRIINSLVNPRNKTLSEPVFIIGTGRCGTSLLKSVIDSNSKLNVFPNETNELWHPMLYTFDRAKIKMEPIEYDPVKFTQTTLSTWPKGQDKIIRKAFSTFQTLKGWENTFIAKSAMISFMIPKILEIFPTARFIHIYRFGPSVVQSYFVKNQGKYKNYHLPDDEYYKVLANYWNDTILEIDKQSKNYPGRILDFSYESLCNDPKEAVDKLAQHLDLESHDFKFDLSKIESMNYKVQSLLDDPIWNELIGIMKPALELKSYNEILTES